MFLKKVSRCWEKYSIGEELEGPGEKCLHCKQKDGLKCSTRGTVSVVPRCCTMFNSRLAGATVKENKI